MPMKQLRRVKRRRSEEVSPANYALGLTFIELSDKALAKGDEGMATALVELAYAAFDHIPCQTVVPLRLRQKRTETASVPA